MTIVIAKCDEGGNHAACFSDSPESRAELLAEHPNLHYVQAPSDTRVGAGPCRHFPKVKAEAIAKQEAMSRAWNSAG